MSGNLCVAYTACPEFRRDFAANKAFCEKCRGDIRPMRQVTQIIDSAMNPIVNEVLSIEANLAAPKIEQAVEQIKHDLAVATGQECSDAEVLVTMLYRMTCRVAQVEAAARLAAHAASQ